MNNYKVTIGTIIDVIVDYALAHNIFEAIASVADYYELNTEDITSVSAEVVN